MPASLPDSSARDPRPDGLRRFSAAVLNHVDRETGYQPPLLRKLMHPRVVLAATGLAVVTFILSLLLPVGSGESVLKGLSAVAAGITFALGYLEWNLARHEASFEKFYDRMSATISTIAQCGLEEAGTHDERLGHLRNIRVFVQLDNIEYVMGKHRLGYIEFDIIDRAIRMFATECLEDWFREKVTFWLREIRGYQRDTYALATYLVNNHDKRF